MTDAHASTDRAAEWTQALEIHRIERVAEDAGHRSIKWAYRPPEVHPEQMDFLPLCASCQAGAAL